jgi:hypothetical protein
MRDLLESLDRIAENELEERVTYRTLAKLSGIENPDKINPGQKITLPGGGSYTVKKGDTLSHIAQAYRLGQIGKKSPPPVADKKPNANTPYVPVTTGDKPQDDFRGIDKPTYEPLPNTYSQGNDDDYTLVSSPKQPNKPNTGPMYEPIDKDNMSNLEKAQQYAKNVNPNLNVKPSVTPSAASADDAIGKSGEKAVDAIKKDYEKSYTKKGVDSIYNTIRNLF